MVYTKLSNELKYSLVNEKSPYIRCKMTDRFDKEVNIDVHGYIFGLIGFQKFKKDNEDHSVILITGLPGSGKSTFVETIAAVDSAFMGERLDMEDIAWSMDNLIKLMDSQDNKKRPVWADEFIQGTSRFNQSNIGIKLKIGFITKRFKRNTYYLVLNNMKECPETLIEMIDGYIHIKKIGFSRGYFDCWVDKQKIYNLWDNFKNYKNGWNSTWVRKIKPDCKGKFNDYRGMFLDNVKFDELKFEQTKQSEKENDSKIPASALKGWKMKKETPKRSVRDIALELEVSHQFLYEWFKKIDKVVA